MDGARDMFPWFHPSVVHFAVALLFTGFLLDVLALWRKSEKLTFAGYWNTLLGTAAAVVAVLSGLTAEESLGPHSRTGDALLSFHRIFGYAGTVVALGLAGARVAMGGYLLPKFRTLYLAFAFLGGGFLLTAGSLGGTLVYGYGLGLDAEAVRKAYEAHAEHVQKSLPPAIVDAGTPIVAAGAVAEPAPDAGPPEAGPPAAPVRKKKRPARP